MTVMGMRPAKLQITTVPRRNAKDAVRIQMRGSMTGLRVLSRLRLPMAPSASARKSSFLPSAGSAMRKRRIPARGPRQVLAK